MRRKVLLADDNATTQRIVELSFTSQDVQVVTVGDGEQAIARIPAERPDIVLAGVGTPKRSGYDVAAFVKGRADLRHIPVLLLTGAFEPVDDARAERVGCAGVLVKPFEPTSVVARVRELIDGAKGSPTQAATAAIPRPAERLTSPAATGAAIPEFANRPVTRSTGAADDYFDRLDAAFATRQGPAPPMSTDPADADTSLPTLDALLSPNGPAPRPAVAPSPQSAAAESTMFADPFVDELTRRVAERLAPDAVREVVVQVVSDVAERLVREEIARVRGQLK